MASAPISNRNQRAIAMLKVAGLYLVTGIILALVFWQNSDVDTDESEKLKAENLQLREQLTQLRGLIALQDSLQGSAQELITLAINKPGRASAEVQDLQVAFDRYSYDLSSLAREFPPELATEKAAISEVRDILDQALEEIQDLMAKQDEETESQEDEIEQVEDQVDELQTQLLIEQQKVALKDQTIAALTSGNKDAKDLVADSETQMATLKGEVKALQKQVDEVYRDIETEYRDRTWPTKTKSLLTLWLSKLKDIQDELDDLGS